MSVAGARPRFEALDVLRGLAVLGMAFSGMVPYRTLPAWMYHAQLPPPSRDYDASIFGLTWVDLVFPIFLFAMGAAIPLALEGKVARGDSNGSILKGLFGRGLMLAVYALVGQHLRPFVLSDEPGINEWIISLVGFVLVGLILLRWPSEIPPTWRKVGTAVGCVGAALVMTQWNYPDDTKGFANYRNDIILMVLANVAVSGGAVWLWTRDKRPLRWIVMAALAAIFLTSELPGLGKTIWDWDPTEYLSFKHGPFGRFLPILYHFEYHKYLLIVLPGTIAGDLIRSANWSIVESGRVLSRWVRLAVVWVGPVAVAIACVGLMARQVAWTTILLSVLSLGVMKLSSGSDNPVEKLSNCLFRIGVPILIVGLLAEPLGGGIRKDPATLSYFLVSSGLSFLLLGSLALAAQSLKNSKILSVIRDTGTNPIMGYLVITNLVWGVVGITMLEDRINLWTQDPILLTGWGLFKTVVVAVVTAWFTRRKIFLRA